MWIQRQTHKLPGRCLLDSLQSFWRGRSVKTFRLLASKEERGRRAGRKENRGGEGQCRFSFEDLCSRRKQEGGGSQHEKTGWREEGDKWRGGDRQQRTDRCVGAADPERGGQKNTRHKIWIKYEQTWDFLAQRSLRGYTESAAINKKNSQCGHPVGGNTNKERMERFSTTDRASERIQERTPTAANFQHWTLFLFTYVFVSRFNFFLSSRNKLWTQ